MKRIVANEELRVELLPSIDDYSGIFAFAMLFDGYAYYGSLERAAEQAMAQRRESLTDLRNELFISCRRSRHQDSDEYIDTYKELYPLLKNEILSLQKSS